MSKDYKNDSGYVKITLEPSKKIYKDNKIIKKYKFSVEAKRRGRAEGTATSLLKYIDSID